MNTMIDPTAPHAGEPTPVKLDPALLEPHESSSVTSGRTSSCTPHRTIVKRGATASGTSVPPGTSLPRVYQDVRIHNGHIPEGPIGRLTIVIESTRYWDHDSPEPWHAFREFPGGGAEIVGTPWTELAQRPAADHRR